MDERTHVNPAAEALGVQRPTRSPNPMLMLLNRVQERYTTLEQHATNERVAGRVIEARLASSAALECARILALHYQEASLTEEHTVWSRRAQRAHVRAYNPPNVVAESIQGGRAQDNYVSDEEMDEPISESEMMGYD